MVVLNVASSMEMLEEFQETYGMRFVGLEDTGGQVYLDYRVPDPESPYPQDIIIDYYGRITHWSWEYDPQTTMAVIDSLLDCGCTLGPNKDPDTGPRMGFSLPQPSVFSRDTMMRLDLAFTTPLRLNIMDANGRLVRTLLDGSRPAGSYQLRWDGRDLRGQRAPSGVYYIRLTSPRREERRRVVLLR